MSIQYFILDARGEPVDCDLLTWARWMETAERHVADDHVGTFRVSTVFLGFDHRILGEGPPLLWETMIFGPRHHQLDSRQRRYSSRAAALEGHAQALTLVRQATS